MERAIGMVALAGISTQVGGAVARRLIGEIGPAHAVALRVALAAVLLAVMVRPAWRRVCEPIADGPPVGGMRGLLQSSLPGVVGLGLMLASMNFAFYGALQRLPLGITVSLEFVGPLGLAALLSRRVRDVGWVILAAAGVLLLTAGPAGSVDRLGIGLALLAGLFWAGYILLGSRTSRALSGQTGITTAMAVAAVAVLPMGLGGDLHYLGEPRLLLLGTGVAVLSSAVPYALDLAAMRRLESSLFGLLTSLQPVWAAAAGLLVLSERLTLRTVVGMAAVVVASMGRSLVFPRSTGV